MTWEWIMQTILMLLLVAMAWEWWRDGLRIIRDKKAKVRKEKELVERLAALRAREPVQPVEGEASEEIHSNMKQYIRTLYAFSGADIVVYLNDEPTGEVQDIKVNEDFINGGVTGSFFVVLFEGGDIHSGRYKDVTKIDVKLANEYGATGGYLIKDVQVLGREHVMSVDDIGIGFRYSFKGSAVGELESSEQPVSA